MDPPASPDDQVLKDVCVEAERKQLGQQIRLCKETAEQYQAMGLEDLAKAAREQAASAEARRAALQPASSRFQSAKQKVALAEKTRAAAEAAWTAAKDVAAKAEKDFRAAEEAAKEAERDYEAARRAVALEDAASEDPLAKVKQSLHFLDNWVRQLEPGVAVQAASEAIGLADLVKERFAQLGLGAQQAQQAMLLQQLAQGRPVEAGQPSAGQGLAAQQVAPAGTLALGAPPAAAGALPVKEESDPKRRKEV